MREVLDAQACQIESGWHGRNLPVNPSTAQGLPDGRGIDPRGDRSAPRRSTARPSPQTADRFQNTDQTNLHDFTS